MGKVAAGRLVRTFCRRTWSARKMGRRSKPGAGTGAVVGITAGDSAKLAVEHMAFRVAFRRSPHKTALLGQGLPDVRQ
jgi:hypothetical protein